MGKDSLELFIVTVNQKVTIEENRSELERIVGENEERALEEKKRIGHKKEG